MPKKHLKYLITLCIHLALSFVVLQASAQGNETFFKFPITKSGVYKISANQLNNLGFSEIDAVSVFGFPGMLPQKLDSVNTTLREIPSKVSDSQLLFYLEGPHQVAYENGALAYHHHLYTDTLYYLIGKKVMGNPINTVQSGNSEGPGSGGRVYQVITQKWEQTNLLNSGRNWFSAPIFSGGNLQYAAQLPVNALNPVELTLKLMAQSLSQATFSLSANGQLINQINIASVPNTTYGIKGREEIFSGSFSSNSSLGINVLFQSTDINATGYLDYSILSIPFQAASLNRGIYHQLQEQDVDVFPGTTTIWNVSNPFDIFEIQGKASLTSGEKIAVFELNEIPSINELKAIGMSLRNIDPKPELLIVTNSLLASQAERLSDHKKSLGIASKVVILEDIYDQFGYGSKDITAIRNFLAFHFHKDRKLKNVMFFGKGTYDYKGKQGGRPNLVPTYSSRNSLNPLTTYSSDDYFGFLEWGQGEWEESNAGDEDLKIGVGRIPAINLAEAREMVNKIISYETGTAISGDWKRNIAFFADDGDNNIHLKDAEAHAAFLSENHPEFLIQKLYLDRFEQVRNGAVQSSPEARERLKDTVKEGVLLLNYIGHGNETTLTAERVFTVSDLNDWPETPYLPLYVTATCEFGRHDSPLIRSAAEELLFVEKKGAIGLLTTGRPVFSSVNFTLNKAFIETVFQKPNGESLDLGEIFRITKNNSQNGPFNRNFSLLGDPSLKLAIPELETRTTSIFDVRLEVSTDTLKAKQQVQITGQVTDPLTGAVLSGSNGNYEIQITDKARTIKSLGDESEPAEFQEEQNLLFKGEGTITNGEFVSNVFIPRNIDYSVGVGTVRIFAQLDNSIDEAMGAVRIPITGTSTYQSSDNEGPEIQMLFGQDLTPAPNVTFPSANIPMRILLEDISGINISSQNIGQDILLRINDRNPIILNSDFIAKGNGFQQGEIQTFLTGLTEGPNTISLEAWDNLGNRSIKTEIIDIKGSLELRILSHLTYPNPSSEKSNFVITHNRQSENLFLELEVYSIQGGIIFKSAKRYLGADFLLDDFEWIFFRSKTKYPVKGTYIYRLLLTSEKDGSSDTKSGKIIIQ